MDIFKLFFNTNFTFDLQTITFDTKFVYIQRTATFVSSNLTKNALQLLITQILANM